MKLHNNSFRIVVFVVSLCFLGNAYAESNNTDKILEPVFFIKPSDKSKWGKINNFHVNENFDVYFEEDFEDGYSHIFYSNIKPDSDAEFINVTESVSAQLLQLGYIPKSYSTQKDCKPWECKYHLDYDLRVIYYPNVIDYNGNLLLTFTHEGCKIKSGGGFRWLLKLGVWNKEHGFKVIDIDGIDDVFNVIIKNNYLFVNGFNENHYQQKIAVISIADGYWGERKKVQPIEPEFETIVPEEQIKIPEQMEPVDSETETQPEVKKPELPIVEEKPVVEQPISWWDKIKPNWWP